MKAATSLSRNIIVYVLAFKQDKTRRDLMRQRLGKHGLEVNFIDAVPGANLSEDERSIFHNSGSRYWSNYRYPDGLIGAALSHFKAWQALLDSEQTCALILEDDALPVSEAIAPCIEALVAMADKLDVVSLYNGYRNRELIKVADMPQGCALSVLRYAGVGAISYFITRGAAQHFLNHHERYIRGNDRFMYHWWRHDCQMLQVSPWLFEEDGRPSNIEHENRTPWEDDYLSRKIIRRFNRLWDSLVKRLYFRRYINNIKRRLTS